MSRLSFIEDYISKEFTNLRKSVNKAKTLETITLKEETLGNLFSEYVSLLKSSKKEFEQKGTWKAHYETYEITKTKFEGCKQLLSKAIISSRTPKYKLKTIAKTIIFVNRLAPPKVCPPKIKFKSVARLSILLKRFPTSTSQIPRPTKIKFKSLAKLIVLLRRYNFPTVFADNPIIRFKTLVKLIIWLNRFPKMTDFDIKTAPALVQPYNGDADGLEAFVDSANLLNELVKADHKPLAAKFLRTRLTGKARLGLPETANTIELIISNVRDRCQEKITPDSIIAKMRNVKQKQSVQTLCDELENLTAKLKSVYLSNKIPDDVASSMANKAGVDALINGVTNSDTKLILKAGTFNNIRDAITKVVENSNSPSLPNAEIFTFASRGRNNFSRNNYQRDFHGNARNFQNNYQRPNYNRGYGQNSGRQYFNRGYNNDNHSRNYDSQNENRSRNCDNRYRNRNNNADNRRYDNNNRNDNNSSRTNEGQNRSRNVYYAENEQTSSARPQPETNAPTGVAQPRA